MRSIAKLAAIPLLTGLSLAQGPIWTRFRPAVAPSARSEHAIAFDAMRGQIILFGGSDGNGALADTWMWNGSTWKQLNPTTSPKARHGHDMVYDTARSRIVLFGGSDGSNTLADTWEWNGTTWSARTPTTAPPARRRHAMAFDAMRKRTVLFGGEDGQQSLADTWDWDGNNWVKQTGNAPTARHSHAMAYDAKNNRIVLFGGLGATPQNDTWLHNGSSWSRGSASGPLARYGHGIAFDAGRDRIVMFGGRDATTVYSNTWEWDGSRWNSIAALVLPSARYYHAMTYDGAKTRAFLFSGDGVSGDTWNYGFTAARYATFGSGCQSASQPCSPCISKNWTRTLANVTTSATRIAILDFHNETLNACGVDLYMAAKSGTVPVNVSIYDIDNQSGLPGKQLRTAPVNVSAAGTYTVSFQPITFSANSIFFVVVDNTDKLMLPVSQTGTTQLHHEWNGSGWGNLKTDLRLQYRVRCDRGRQVPTLSASGTPVPGGNVTINLGRVPGNRAGAFFLGLSKTAWGALQLPLDLGTAAPGCRVYASGEVIQGFVTAATGTFGVTLPIPNSPDLKGSMFFNQFFVLDPQANPLGLIVSNAGEATIGDG